MKLSLRHTVLPVLALALVAVGSAQPASQQPASPPSAQTPAQPAQPPAQPQAEGQQPPEGEQPVFRGGINFVRVDVIVTDKQGNPVTDLKQQDFEVAED